MLLALAIGSGALAVTRMAAWWVIVPPSFMLLGYVALLREAARADAERREVTRTHAERTATRPASPPAARPATSPASRPAVPAAPVVATAPPATAPSAEVIDISATLVQAGEEFYDQYKDAKRRAVGDLTRVLAG